jgi:hypothetical protein
MDNTYRPMDIYGMQYEQERKAALEIKKDSSKNLAR